ncbi:MAG TPA: HAMP domain-containing sensor histidine kinase [Holophaga sp.]|nr:HAMP domain-containing sensor histidine kinase [Holophaga sp.]
MVRDAAPPEARAWTPVLAAAGFWAAATVTLEILVRRPGCAGVAVLVDDGTRCALAFTACWALAARAHTAPRAFAGFWRAFAWAMGCMGGATLWLILTHDLLHLPAPIPTLRHGGYLAAMGFLAWGVLRLPVESVLASHRLQAFLDGLLISASLFFIAWATYLHELVGKHLDQGAPYALTLVYPLLSTALGALWIVQEHRIQDARMGRPGRLVRLGLGITVAWWPVYAIGNIQGWYRTLGPSERMDAVHALGLLCFALAALWPQRPQLGDTLTRARRRTTLLPYALALAAVAFAGLLYLLEHPFDPVMVGTGGLMALILTLRQYLAVRDLEALSRNLEARVSERTQELTRSQQELLRSQRMRLMAAMAAGLSHDFKNLLGIIRTWAEALREEAADPDQAKGLAAIHEASDRALDLVQGVLASGRQLELAPRTFDLGDFLRERTGRLEGVLGGRARLELDLAEGAIPVLMDPDKLELALANLASNAADAMDARGTFALRARRDPVEPFALLEVADDGRGIPPGDLDRIFEPFFTTKPVGKGTGLGLPSVQGFVLQSGGTLAVESRPGEGTRFTLRLPRGA